MAFRAAIFAVTERPSIFQSLNESLCCCLCENSNITVYTSTSHTRKWSPIIIHVCIQHAFIQCEWKRHEWRSWEQFSRTDLIFSVRDAAAAPFGHSIKTNHDFRPRGYEVINLEWRDTRCHQLPPTQQQQQQHDDRLWFGIGVIMMKYRQTVIIRGDRSTDKVDEILASMRDCGLLARQRSARQHTGLLRVKGRLLLVISVRAMISWLSGVQYW